MKIGDTVYCINAYVIPKIMKCTVVEINGNRFIISGYKESWCGECNLNDIGVNVFYKEQEAQTMLYVKNSIDKSNTKYSDMFSRLSKN